MNDDFSQYKASNFKKKDDFSQYNAENFRKKDESFAQKLPRNVAIGVTELGRGLLNTPHNVAALFGLGERVAPLAPQDFDYASFYGQRGEPTLSDKIIQGLVQYAPALALGGAPTGLAGEAVASIPRVGAFAERALSQAIPQAAFGATQNENPLIGSLEGGAGSLAGSLLGKGIEGALNKLRPSSILRGALSPEELQHNLEVARGTETGLGRVLDSPLLTKAQENVLPYVLGSGAEKTMQRNANKIEELGENLLSKLRKGKPVSENYGEDIKNALNQAFEKAEQEKNAKFSKVNELAEKSGIKTNRKNLRNEAASILSQIKSDPDLAKFTNAEDINLINSIVGKEPVLNGKNVSVITGKPINAEENYSLKNTDILRSKIGENAYEASVKGEKSKAMMYGRLKAALEKDIDSAIESSGNESLKNARKEAMHFYKSEYAPFEDKDLRKFIKQGGDPDLILNHFLKIGKNDRGQLLSKLSRSTQSEPNLLGNSYLSSAYENGKINPVKLSTLYHKLGKNQRKQIFGAKESKEIGDYVDLVNKNKESFDLMRNPKTGARVSSIAQAVLAPTHIPLAFASAFASKLANKLLTSPSYREKLVGSMLKNEKVEIPRTKRSMQKGAAAITGAFGSDKEQKPMELELIGGR